MASPIPTLESLESTVAWRRDPYRFISRQCRRLRSDVFECRLLLRPTICMSGAACAELFYDESRFQREGAAPGLVKQTLFGPDGVQVLDDAAHRHRRGLFLELTDEAQTAAISAISERQWERAAIRWSGGRGPVVLFDEAREVLTRTVCEWAAVPLPESEVGTRTKSLTALFDGAGSVGAGHLRSRFERKRATRWASDLVRRVRNGDLKAPEQSALSRVARHTDLDGRPLPADVAATELLNLLRPTVAVAVYIALAAAALEQYPAERERLASGRDEERRAFAEEVRRFYPFFPVLVAVVREGFEWNGMRFPAGRRVMLDLYGTSNDSREWERPEEFRPDRWWSTSPSACPFSFIPQGGGARETAHRCPGEPFTVELMVTALAFLTQRVRYRLPAQDLSIDFVRLPALPRSGVVLDDVSRKEASLSEAEPPASARA